MSRTKGSIALVFLLAFSAAAAAQNLVPDGGFEHGAQGWEGGSVVAEGARSGAACLQVDDASPAENAAAYTAEIIPIRQGQAYRFEAWVRAPAEGQAALVSLNQYDASGEWRWGKNQDFAVTPGTAWTRLSLVLRAWDAETAGIRIVFYPVMWTDAGDLTGRAWFDDVSLEEVPDDRETRGSWIAQGGAVRAWLSPVEQKVEWDRALAPSAPSVAEVSLYAARGEHEPFQLVLLPGVGESLVEASVADWRGKKGARVPASSTVVREVAYVRVTDPTDFASYPGWQPDPLPPLQTPLALTAGAQQPLWVTVKVPHDARAGEYTSTLTLRFSASAELAVPLRLKVWGFALPRTRHLRTAYGLGLGTVDRYHNLGGDPEKLRQTFRLYLQDFSDHRISPYNPYGNDYFQVGFPDWNWVTGRIVADPETPSGPNRVLEVEDDRADLNVATQADNAIPVRPGASYALSFRVRTDGAHEYLLSLNQYDTNGEWIPGHNLDVAGEGTGGWQSVDTEIPPAEIPPETAFLRLYAYARTWTDEGELTGRTWFDDVVFKESGSAQNLVSNGDFQLAPDQARLETDFTAFDAAMSHAEEAGFDAFVLPLPYFASGFLSQHWVAPFLGCEWGTPEYGQAYGRVVAALTDHLAANGWLDEAYTYWYDEPDAPDYPFVCEGMGVLKSADPRLKRLLTEQYEPGLDGCADIWSPILDQYDPSWAHARQDLGEQVWWYVCTGPKAPYPNDFIDHPGIEHRVRYWMAWQYGVQGDLFWDTTYWTNGELFTDEDPQDPWTDPASYSTWGGYVSNYGNGDGRLLYPPRGWKDGLDRIEGPVPSLRWELIREGIEDYEYFALLKEAADELERRHKSPKLAAQARGLLAVPSDVFTTLVAYTGDPAPLAAHRQKLAACLEKIEKKLR